MPFYSPLRYPGGKRQLAEFFKLVVRENDLTECLYIEPYSGGAAVALELLFEEYAGTIWINDLDYSLYAFWHSAVNHTEELVARIVSTPVTMEVWEAQKEVQTDPSAPLLDLGFSTFFLNRTNRSGIIRAGVIGGKDQKGKYKLDARFNKQDLVARLQKIGRYRERIRVLNQDAAHLLRNGLPFAQESVLIYLDPPYYAKSTEDLYQNSYDHTDHANVAELLQDVEYPWVVSYDNVKPVRRLYAEYEYRTYDIHYSAQERYEGAEVVFFSHGLMPPSVKDPARV